jgi:hypothetical protein
MLLGGVIEAAVRSPMLEHLLPVGSYGIPSRYFDFQMDRLHHFAKDHGAPDCIFLGSSVVFRGIDPDAFESGYRLQTGETIRCFNFGVRGLDPVSEALLAGSLLVDYTPGLLVVGLEVPNLVSGAAEGLRDRFPPSTWAQHRLGHLSLEGWLIDTSMAFRTYLVYRNWMKPDFSAESLRHADVELAAGVNPSGYGGVDFAAPRVGQIPDSQDPQAHFFDLLRVFNLDSAQSHAVEALSGLSRQTGVVLFEPPLHSSFLTFFGQGRADYLRGVAFLEATAAQNGATFLSTTLLDLVPDDGWRDRNHLNRKGAETFSRWLGMQIGQAVIEGKIPNPTGPGGSGAVAP